MRFVSAIEFFLLPASYGQTPDVLRISRISLQLQLFIAHGILRFCFERSPVFFRGGLLVEAQKRTELYQHCHSKCADDNYLLLPSLLLCVASAQFFVVIRYQRSITQPQAAHS